MNTLSGDKILVDRVNTLSIHKLLVDRVNTLPGCIFCTPCFTKCFRDQLAKNGGGGGGSGGGP